MFDKRMILFLFLFFLLERNDPLYLEDVFQNGKERIVSKKNEQCAVRKSINHLSILISEFKTEEEREEIRKSPKWEKSLIVDFLESELEILEKHYEHLRLYKRRFF